MSLFCKKTTASPAGTGERRRKSNLKRTPCKPALVSLGIGADTELDYSFVPPCSGRRARGSAVTISFIIAAVGCAFAGLCYAVFASMIPIAGSAYTYAYVVTMQKWLPGSLVGRLCS
ncbi:MAG: hypothetical protein U0T81_08585 [Saprospiraceae bacterium]